MVDIAEIRKKAKKKRKGSKKESAEKTGEKELTSSEVAETLFKDEKVEEKKPSQKETPKKEKETGEEPERISEQEEDLLELTAQTLLAEKEAIGEKLLTSEKVEEFLGIKINNEEYGLSIQSVMEIIKIPPITEVPLTPDYVLGIIYLRGKVTPTISLHKKLGFPIPPFTKNSRIVIVDNGEEPVGVVVDEVTQVFRIPITKIEPPPVGQKEPETQFVSGIARYEGIFLRIIDIKNATSITISGFEGDGDGN